jgi:ubiquinone/menaquinone biosynthesis C-methylase UbiE
LDVFGIDLSPEMLAVAHLPAAFAEFHRVLAPGGHVMLALYLLARKS